MYAFEVVPGDDLLVVISDERIPQKFRGNKVIVKVESVLPGGSVVVNLTEFKDETTGEQGARLVTLAPSAVVSKMEKDLKM